MLLLHVQTAHKIVEATSLLNARGANQINLYLLIKYIHESKLAYKVESYASHVEEQESNAVSRKTAPSSTPVLHTLSSFLSALTNLSTEGRIFFEKAVTQPNEQPDGKLSYLLLSPTHAFSSIASRARAVILAGGTMSPFEDYKIHLFPGLTPDRISTLSCGHVIPATNLCVSTLASARGDQVFEFSFQKRSDRTMVRQLGLAILNVCAVVPDGVVVFFPSYGYLNEVVNVWQTLPENERGAKSVWERLQAIKTVFLEEKGCSSDEVLQQYSQAILGSEDSGGGKTGGASSSAKSGATTQASNTTRTGALLLSVVGGKMSEGINFSDRLGRCVIIVGLPYPNINSPDWKARIEYIESVTVSKLMKGDNQQESESPNNDRANESCTPRTSGVGLSREQAVTIAKQASRDFYENACMRAVNQSIGRAIRHRNDYAAIVLVDRRFASERIRGKLPAWIRSGMVERSEKTGMQGLLGSLSAFFRAKKGSCA
jgi:chromosome transmission fidelity protein 1